tara:strand:+ start:3780 stop:4862 length:1083 start_codon:yes stop_codon:yes gene_type:complete
MKNIFKKRLSQLTDQISDIGYNGLYITNLTNIRYLTGFSGSAAVLLIINGESYFLTDGRYIKQSADQVKNSKILIIDSGYLSTINKHKLLIQPNLKIGFESNHLSVSDYTNLTQYFSHINWDPTSAIIENIAAIKDQYEIDSLKTAIKITDYVFEKIISEIKPGITEREISAKISYLFKTNGAEGDSYESIIASGPNSALPHARPTNRKFQKSDFIVMDFGALYNGYHADMTRTVLMGPITKKHQQIYDIVLKSQLQGIAHAKEGVPCSSVDKACRDIIDSAGYGDFFNHSTGHGIGLEVHTLPRIHKSNNQILKSNHIITIEPGIYLPDWGGVRIEDDCLIMKEKCVPLNKSTKELISI